MRNEKWAEISAKFDALGKHYAFLENLGAIALVFNIIGALLVAGATYQLEGYAFFLVGSILWVWRSLLSGDRAALLQWGFFLAVNCYGIFQRV